MSKKATYAVDYDGNDTSWVLEQTDDILRHLSDAVALLYRTGVYSREYADVRDGYLVHEVRYALNNAGVEWIHRDRLNWQRVYVGIPDEQEEEER